MAKDFLDLHGCKSDEAEALLDQFLFQASNARLKRARIMTGKGAGIIKKLTIKYLEMAGYHWTYEKLANGKSNEGCLVVFVE